ncbi:DDB1- and CUL4-associated factor 8-like [Melia azedarach]|uniref:DDB1- and CUL4-associated factor 8-like n=1 Tax=Melia azedarach TaxID=155640 RepID=A0ACC1XZ07_MELAZ|nr:DDB1- and CUL4-associated factor 8-like [Melia azedarach]
MHKNNSNNNNKRARSSVDKAVVDVWLRELGQLSTRNFAHRRRASEDLILRLDIYKKLDKHRGCVNTVSFNTNGDILVSGSDDRRVILWDWETGHVKLSFHSGHNNNVFQAKLMPYSDDRSVVTCAADGQVRHAQILERGGVETKLLAKHRGRAHKLAIEPGSPHIFYTCGEDGVVQHFDLRTGAATELFTCLPIDDRRSYMPVVNLNAITIDPRNPNLFAVAGADEYTRLYDIRKYKWDGSTEFGQPADYFCPPHLIGDEQVGITGLAFSDHSELLVSYNDEFIYLFTQDMGLGLNPHPSSPLSMGSDASEMGSDNHSAASPSTTNTDGRIAPQVYKGHRNVVTVKGVSFFGPKCEYVVSGSDCGRIFVWKKKGGELIRVMEADKHVVNCIEPHPHSTMLASSGIENDIKIWTPKAVNRATLPTNIEEVLIPDRIHCSHLKARGWMHHVFSPEDLMLQLFSLQRQRTEQERNGEDSAAGRELLELILTFNTNSDRSSDDGDELRS